MAHSRGIHESGGTDLAIGSVPDGAALVRSGAGLIGAKATAFKVRLTSAQGGFAQATSTKVQFTTIDYDSPGGFDAVTNFNYTVTEAGIYLFQGGVGFAAVAIDDGAYVELYKNGALLLQGGTFYSRVATDLYINGSWATRAAVGDTYDLHAQHSATGSLSTLASGTSTYFMGTKIPGGF